MDIISIWKRPSAPSPVLFDWDGIFLSDMMHESGEVVYGLQKYGPTPKDGISYAGAP